MLRRRLLTISLALTALALPATPSLACSVTGPGPLTGVAESWDSTGGGIYEQRTIAWAPPILIRDTATASVVTRFWGRPPANVGVQYEGGEWFSFVGSLFEGDSCAGTLDRDGNFLAPDGPVGTVGYGLAPPPENATGPLSPEERAAQGTVPLHRTAPFLVLENEKRTGNLSENEITVLESAFGTPTVLDISLWTRVQATAVVWAPVLLAVALAIFFVGGGLRVIRRGKDRGHLGPASIADSQTEPH